jgi:hypothetical protein
MSSGRKEVHHGTTKYEETGKTESDGLPGLSTGRYGRLAKLEVQPYGILRIDT